jgi:hypothetical protein
MPCGSTMPSYVELGILLVTIGSAWGHLRSGQNRNGKDITSIKKALGLENGYPPAFVRREQYEDAVERIEEDLSELQRRLRSPRSNI